MQLTAEEWVQKTFRPHVMIACTPTVDNICGKNNLTFVDLLKPFQNLQNVGSMSTRTAEKSYSLKNFGLRFVSANEVQTARKEVSDKYLDKLTSRLSPDFDQKMQERFSIRDPEDVPAFFQRNPDPCPWYTTYRTQLMDVLRFSQFEFLDHPIAFMVAVASNDDKPIEQLKELSSNRNLPQLFRNGFYDSSIHRSYILLHDLHDTEGLPRAKQIMKQMKRYFPPDSCHILQINSNPFQHPTPPERNIWKPFIRLKPSFVLENDQKQHSEIHGQYLSKSDVNNLSSFVSDLAIHAIVPQMEKKIRFLNGQIASERKGFRNQIKFLFSRKPKNLSTAVNAPLYDLMTVESKIRQLADFAFVMQNYEMAREHYQLVSSDYRNDKAHHYLAGAQEMLALCLLLTNGRLHDIETCFDVAFKAYSGPQVSDNRRATRVAMWTADAFRRFKSKERDSGFLIKAVEKENDIRGALLLEQAAYMFLLAYPPMVRKYAFHLTMAGNLYHKCNQRKHVIRCYSLAIGVYTKRKWHVIEDHIHHFLGRQWAHLGNYEEAIDFFLTLIGSGRQSLERQSNWLREFVVFVKKSSDGEMREIKALNLPLFKNDSVEVIVSNKNTVISDLAPLVWKKATSQHEQKLFDLHDIWTKSDGLRCSVVGEPIIVEIELTNPLKMNLSVQNVCLVCHMKDRREPLNGGASDFDLKPTSLVLSPNSTKKISLSVTCNSIGHLQITGITWELYEVVRGLHELPHFKTRLEPLEILNKKRGRHRERSKSQIPIQDQCLLMPVVDAMPRLSCTTINFPRHMYHGEIVRSSIELKNTGPVAMTNILLKLSNSKILFPCKLDGKTICPCSSDRDLVFDLEVGILESGDSFELPVWVSGADTGNHELEFLFRYQQEGQSPLPFRLFHLPLKLEILPLLKVDVSLRPSFSRIREHVLVLQMTNLQSLDHLGSLANTESYAQMAAALPTNHKPLFVQIQRVTTFSTNWKIEPLAKDDCTIDLHGNESTTVFFRLTPTSAFHEQKFDEDQKREDDIVSSNVIMNVKPSVLSDCLSSPYSNFLDAKKAIKNRQAYQHALASGVDRPPPNPNNLSLILSWRFAGGLDEEKESAELEPPFSEYEDNSQELISSPFSSSPDNSADGGFPPLRHLSTSSTDPLPLHRGHGRRGFHDVEQDIIVGTQPVASCPLRITVHHPCAITHDFQGQSLLEVDVEILIFNCSEKQPVSFQFDTLPPEEEFDPSARAFRARSSPSLRSRYFWKGRTRFSLADLQPNDVYSVNLTACFLRTGTYNLNRFRFGLKMENPRAPRVFFFPLQHLITINPTRRPIPIRDSDPSLQDIPLHMPMEAEPEQIPLSRPHLDINGPQIVAELADALANGDDAYDMKESYAYDSYSDTDIADPMSMDQIPLSAANTPIDDSGQRNSVDPYPKSDMPPLEAVDEDNSTYSLPYGSQSELESRPGLEPPLGDIFGGGSFCGGSFGGGSFDGGSFELPMNGDPQGTVDLSDPQGTVDLSDPQRTVDLSEPHDMFSDSKDERGHGLQLPELDTEIERDLQLTQVDSVGGGSDTGFLDSEFHHEFNDDDVGPVVRDPLNVGDVEKVFVDPLSSANPFDSDEDENGNFVANDHVAEKQGITVSDESRVAGS